MDRDVAIQLCLDRINVWASRVRDLLNGTANAENIARLVGDEDQDQAQSADTPELVEGFDVTTASRDELLKQCLALGYVQGQTAGKPVKVLREMIVSKTAEQALEPAESSATPVPLKKRLTFKIKK